MCARHFHAQRHARPLAKAKRMRRCGMYEKNIRHERSTTPSATLFRLSHRYNPPPPVSRELILTPSLWSCQPVHSTEVVAASTYTANSEQALSPNVSACSKAVSSLVPPTRIQTQTPRCEPHYVGRWFHEWFQKRPDLDILLPLLVFLTLVPKVEAPSLPHMRRTRKNEGNLCGEWCMTHNIHSYIPGTRGS